jgi:hypothetical protein
MCNQSKFGSLFFMPMNLENVRQIKIYQKLIDIVLFVIAKDHLVEMSTTMYAYRSRARYIWILFHKTRQINAITHDVEIEVTKLEFIIQHVHIVQTARQLCNELGILRVQRIKNIMEENFHKIFIILSYLILVLRSNLKNWEFAMWSITNNVMHVNCICVALTLARHKIGWSGKN